MTDVGFFEGAKIKMAKRDDTDVLLARHPKYGFWMLRRHDNEQILLLREDRTEILKIAVEYGLFIYNI